MVGCMLPDLRTGAIEMSEPNSSDIKSRANETFGEMYARFEREAWASGGYVTAAAVMIICSVRLLVVLPVRLVSRLFHSRTGGV
jgi:hypothetical protein